MGACYLTWNIGYYGDNHRSYINFLPYVVFNTHFLASLFLHMSSTSLFSKVRRNQKIKSIKSEYTNHNNLHSPDEPLN